VALFLALLGCSEPPLAGASKAKGDAVADVAATEGLSGSEVAEQDAGDAANGDSDHGDTAQSEEAIEDASVPPADEVTVVQDGQDADTDLVAEVTDAVSVPACVGCDWQQQPPAPHPGGKGPHPLSAKQTLAYGSGFGQGYKQMLVYAPLTAGVWPVLLFVPGKQLASGGGLVPKLGYPYDALLQHVASHGFVVALVSVEQSALDADHQRMADDMLAAQAVLTSKVTTADGDKVAYAGHSMGAKVALLAAYKAINLDTLDKIADPVALILFAISNDPPPIGTYQDAVPLAKQLVPSAATWYTFVQAHDDAVAPYLDAKKPNAAALYAALQTEHKQLLVLHGTGAGDPNDPSTPELHDDHAWPLTVEGKPGSLADFAMPDSHLDALDWYGSWKILVGVLRFHFQAGDPQWGYGALRTHGGVGPQGKVITHEVYQQGWKGNP